MKEERLCELKPPRNHRTGHLKEAKELASSAEVEQCQYAAPRMGSRIGMCFPTSHSLSGFLSKTLEFPFGS